MLKIGLEEKDKASSKQVGYFDNIEDLADDFGTKQAIKGSKIICRHSSTI